MANNDRNKPNISTRPKAESSTKDRAGSVERDLSTFSVAGIRSGTLNHFTVKIVMILLILIFAVGFLIAGFNPTAGINGGAQGPQKLTSTATVATVGNDNVERGRLETLAVQNDSFMEQYGQKTGPMEYFGSRQRSLKQLTDNLALIQAARDAGITVSEDDIKAKIGEQIKEIVDNGTKSEGEANFRRKVESQYGSMDDFRAQMLAELEKNRDGIEKTLLTEKLEKKIKDENKVTAQDYNLSVTKFKLRVITVRPKIVGAADKAAQEKNKAEAKTKAEKLLQQLQKNPLPQNFAAIAKKESDDLASKAKGGDLGWKMPAEMSFSPDVRDQLIKQTGKLVGPIADENSGDQYIFFVEGRALNYPKDYGKKKAELFKGFETTQDDEAWRKYQDKISKATKVDLVDPAFQAYKIQTEDVYAAQANQQDALRRDAVAKYESAISSSNGLEAAAIHFQLAQLYKDLKEPKKAAESLKAAIEQSKDTPALQVEYARALRDAGDKKTALAELEKVSKAMDTAPPSPPSMFGGNPDDALRYQISSEFESLGRKDLATKERAKVKPPQGMGMPGMGMPGGGQLTIPPR